MTKQFLKNRRGIFAICLLALLALMIMASGCAQTASQQTKTPAPVTATRTDNTHILITYPGSTETSDLLELEITVTDSTGKAQIKSIGDRHSTTPLKFGATQVLTGTFSGNDHVQIIGYFMDSSYNTVLDTTI